VSHSSAGMCARGNVNVEVSSLNPGNLISFYHLSLPGDEGLRPGSNGLFCGSGHGLDTFLFASVRLL
jgi:hypothetical protein